VFNSSFRQRAQNLPGRVGLDRIAHLTGKAGKKFLGLAPELPGAEAENRPFRSQRFGNRRGIGIDYFASLGGGSAGLRHGKNL